MTRTYNAVYQKNAKFNCIFASSLPNLQVKDFRQFLWFITKADVQNT